MAVDPRTPQEEDRLVHSCFDEEGLIEVVDEREIRTLYFGTNARQSAMARHAPDRLVLPYTRYMLTGLLFCREPRRALVLGMGGASLPRFLVHAFPDCQVDVVERRAKILEVARDHFQLPSSPTLRIHLMDAGRFLREWRGQRFDLILVDLHDQKGTAPVVREAGFFSACARLLRRGGVLSTNIWTGSAQAANATVNVHRATFGTGHLVLPVPERGNVILLGLPFPAPSYARPRLELRARELQARLGIELTRYLFELSGTGRV